MRHVDSHLRVVILAGGIGSRFWPASSPARPKQLLPLGAERSLIAQTIDRALALAPKRAISVLTGAHLIGSFRESIPELDPDQFWIEPRARGTAPVLTWAAHRIHRRDPEAVMVSLHADHSIEPVSAFVELLHRAVALARQEDLLLTIAVPPSRPETGYGYLRTGDLLAAEDDLRAWRVEAFREKPDASTAMAYLSRGHFWNSGIFILPVSRFLDEVRLHAPEIGQHLSLLELGEESAFFEAVPTISVDEAVLERSGSVGAVRATFEWDDIGNWDALLRTGERDADGNWRRGESFAFESADSVVWAEDGPVVLFGVRDLVVVRAGGVTLVADRNLAPELKRLLQRLPPRFLEGASRRDEPGDPGDAPDSSPGDPTPQDPSPGDSSP